MTNATQNTPRSYRTAPPHRGGWFPRAGVATGATLIIVGVVFGILGTPFTMFLMQRAISQSRGIGDPKALATSIGYMMDAMFIGLGAGLAGCVILALSFVAMKRERSRAAKRAATPPPIPR